MAENKRSAGFLQIFLLVVLIVAAGVTIWVIMYNRQHSREVQAERARYAELDSQAQHYIETINAKYPGKVTHETSCNYTSVKLGKGALSCRIESTISYDNSSDSDSIINLADTLQSTLKWGKGEDISNAERRSTLYFDGRPQSCEIRYYENQDEPMIAAVCSGSALTEYYPVVGD
jgi:hypothetical protein